MLPAPDHASFLRIFAGERGPEGPPPGNEHPSWSPLAHGLSPHVLIAEDDSLIALSIRVCVERYGYSVCGMAATGGEALDLEALRSPDIVLMDVRLRGGMDGLMAAERMMARRNVPIVFVTAFNDSRTLERMNAIGAAGLVFKPFLPEQLCRTMGRAMGFEPLP